MGIVWEAYKGVPLLGVPGITLESMLITDWIEIVDMIQAYLLVGCIHAVLFDIRFFDAINPG